MSYDTIVVGLGASGTAAASTLARAGRRVLALEAQDRIGGRVNTVPFGDSTVELGAEWIHGTKNSSLYNLAKQHNITLKPQDLTFVSFRSNGARADDNIVNELLDFSLEVVEEPPERPGPLGEYIMQRVKDYVTIKYPHLLIDQDFLPEFYNFMDLVIDNYESSNSWNEVSTATNYRELEGDQHLSWHRIGYKTMFDLLLNRQNNGSGLPSLDIKLNTAASAVNWSRDGVTVTCQNGNIYKADNVIVTMSLGVLKEIHSQLFTPPLPPVKVHIINTLSIGIVNKIVLLFKEAWWPQETSFFGFIWHRKDRIKIPQEDLWMTKIFGVSCPMSNRKVLTVWTSGDGAKIIEALPEDILKRKTMEVVRMFMGKEYAVEEPLQMLRSTWYSNPYTRGSYSFDNLSTPHYPNARSTLATPVTDSAGVNRVLFAGEATEVNYFSTVHGALDSGYREAERLLKVSSKI